MTDLAERSRFSYQVFDTLEPLETAWRALDAAPECSVHQTFDWCRIWVEESGCKPLVIAATFADGDYRGETAFILPLMVVRNGPVKTARYMSAPFNNINFGLFSEHFLNGVTAELMASIKRELMACRIGVDLLVLDRQPENWRGATHPFTLFPRVENQNRAFQVSLAGGVDAVLTRSNAKRRRKKVRISERRLDELGGYRHIKAKTADEAQRLLDAFFEQKAVRFKAHGLPDAFEAPRTKAFFHRLARESVTNTRKMLEMHAIQLANGTICAVAALSCKGGHVICQFSSIRPGETERASPGELLFYLMIRDACESGAELFDFGIGDEQFKRSWCDTETVHYDTVIALTAVGRLAAQAARLIVVSKRLTKSNPATFRWAKALRFTVKR